MSLEPKVDMTLVEIQAFLAEPRMAVLGTILRDGMPSLNPVWYLYEDGRFLLSMDRNVYYAKNLARDPRASLCVQEESYPLKAVVARGSVAIAPDTGHALVRRLAPRYRGEEGGREYLEKLFAIPGLDLVAVTLTPERLASWDYGKR